MLPKSPPRNLKYVVQIIHKGVVLATESSSVNDDILQYARERNFNMEVALQKVVANVVPRALENYEKKQLGEPFDPINPKNK